MIEIGSVVEGVVTGIQSYGAFVMLDNGQTGLIHISEITAKFVKNIGDFVTLGDRIKVKVLALDEKTGNAKLSIKALEEMPARKHRRQETLSSRMVSKINDPRSFDALTRYRDQVIVEKHKESEAFPMIQIETNKAFIGDLSASYQEKVNAVHEMIHQRTGAGADFLGWLDQPVNYDVSEMLRIVQVAETIRRDYDVLVVCGIGGSYLGTRAAIEFLQGLLPAKKEIEIVFFGNTFSPTYTAQMMEYLKTKKFAVNVISKSGTTTETAIAFRLLKQLAEEKYGKEKARKAIVATTDKARGVLKTLADEEGYESFVIPDDIGGRYSVITAVGLFPLAVAGFDPREILLGSAAARIDTLTPDLKKNVAYQLSIARDYWYRHGKTVDLLVTYEPHLVMLGEWWKQLFGESEGKEGKGMFPASVNFSTDLHSLGQFVQEGTKTIVETVLTIAQPMADYQVPKDAADKDGLNYLAGKSMSFINEQAMKGTLAAHADTGSVPNIQLVLKENTPFSLGYLFFFFMKVCAMSAYLLEINPFNQPGVEVYKKNMFQLLGKK